MPRGAPIATTALFWFKGTGYRSTSRFAAERLVLSFLGICDEDSLCLKFNDENSECLKTGVYSVSSKLFSIFIL